MKNDIGPCYDFCSCRHCWNGWKTIPFLTRLHWRIQYIFYNWTKGF